VQSSRLALSAASKTQAETGLEGKFSIPYCVANALITGQTGTQAFTDEKVRDPAVNELMKKITVAMDPELKTLESRVEMETRGGEVHRAHFDVLKEIPPLDLKRERVKRKFLDLCEPIMGADKAGALGDQILALEKLPSLRAFAESL
jgi:2-methylcitrate dehydratase PrpD